MNSNLDFQKKFKYFLVFLAASLIIYFFDQFGYLSFLHQATDFFIVPTKKIIYQNFQTFLERISFFKGDKTTENLIKNLEKKEKELLVVKEKIRFFEEENRALRKQLETPLPPQWEYLDAKVIGFSDGLSINKGKKEGLKNEQIVLTENILVGKLKNVNYRQSFIELPTNPQAKIAVITGKTKARGVLTGEFGTKIVLTNVLQEDKLEVKDTVLTAGIAGFPKGLLIGKIKKIIKKETDIYQTAEIEPLLKYEELETVFVLVKE